MNVLFNGSNPFATDRVRSLFDDNSLMRSDSCLLNGDVWFKCDKPRYEPCLCNNVILACGLSIAFVLIFGVVRIGMFSRIRNNEKVEDK